MVKKKMSLKEKKRRARLRKELRERLRWAKYPLPTEAIKTKTFRKHKARLKRTTDHSDAYCHERAINSTQRVLKIRRMARVLNEMAKGKYRGIKP